jgi:hypothetical protein
MFSAPLIGFLLGLGVAAWIYSQMMRRTGGNNQSSLVIAGIVGLIAFVVALITVSIIDSSLGK